MSHSFPTTSSQGTQLAHFRLGRRWRLRGLGDLPTRPRSAAAERHREWEPDAPGSRVIASRLQRRAYDCREFGQRTREQRWRRPRIRTKALCAAGRERLVLPEKPRLPCARRLGAHFRRSMERRGHVTFKALWGRPRSRPQVRNYRLSPRLETRVQAAGGADAGRPPCS